MIKKTSLLFFVLLTSLKILAYDAFINGIYYNLNYEKKEAEVTCKVFNISSSSSITYQSDYSGDIRIPDSVEVDEVSFLVTSIGDCAFGNCSSMTSISLPEGIKSIGRSAFNNCYGLTSISLPKGIKTISDDAFIGCWQLPEEDGIIYADFFAVTTRDKTKTTYNLKESTRFIGHGAFGNCTNLTNFYIPESVIRIGYWAFSDCSSLSNITIPQSVMSIGDKAFSGCISLPIEDGIRYAGDYAIEVIDRNQVNYNLKGGTRFIGSNAFDGCTRMVSITIPETVKSIGERAFAKCSSLIGINIPLSVTNIGNEAFSGSTGMTSVTISGNINSIGKQAFYNCRGLKSVNISDIKAWCNIDFEDLESNPLYYAYNLNLNGNLATNINIPDGIKEIKKNTFVNCSSITSVILPSTLARIDKKAFSGCNCLETINIPESVVFIGESAFSYCFALASIDIPISLSEINERVFWGCSSLSSITIPSSVVSISDEAFYGCGGLSSITIPSSVKNIGKKAFHNSNNLKEVYIDNIDWWMANSSYSDGNIFTSPYNLYVNGQKLDNLIIPENYFFVPAYCFDNCESLLSITLHEDVNALVQNAFLRCYNVQKIVCNGTTPPACGTNALLSISKTDCKIIVPDGTEEAYRNAPTWCEFTNIIPFSESIPKYTLQALVQEGGSVQISPESENYIYNEGTEVTLTAVANDGYEFIGWSNGKTDNPLTITVDKDMTITAVFEAKSYVITYYVDGENYKSETYKYGATITPIAEPEKEGHTFSGWSEIPEIMPAHDVTVTGTFTVNKYMVRYYDGETLLAEFEVEFGAEIPQYEYNNEEFIFEGWEGKVYDTMPAHDIVYYAITTPNSIANILIDDNAEIIVYDLTGLTVYKGKRAGIPQYLQGLYIIKYGDKSIKCKL